MKFNLLAITTFSTLLLSACYYDSMEELYPAPIIIPGLNDSTASGCDTAKVITYTNDIKPIFSSNCGADNSCHKGSSSNSGSDLSTYAGAQGVAGSLVGAVTWDGSASQMPKGSTAKINDCSIAKIKKWVNTGTKE
jgi:hypothetical protein